MKKKVNLSARCSNMNVPQNYEEIVTNCYFFFASERYWFGF